MGWFQLALLLFKVANAILGEIQRKRIFKQGQRDILDKINAETEKSKELANAARDRARAEHAHITRTEELPDDGFRRD